MSRLSRPSFRDSLHFSPLGYAPSACTISMIARHWQSLLGTTKLHLRLRGSSWIVRDGETNGLGSLEKHPFRYLSLQKHRNFSRFCTPKSPGDLPLAGGWILHQATDFRHPWPIVPLNFQWKQIAFLANSKKSVVGSQNFTCPTCWIFCSIPQVFGWFPSLISVGMPPWWAAFFNNFSLSMTQNPPSNWNCETKNVVNPS